MFLLSFSFFFFLMIRRPPISTRTDTLFPYTTLFRSASAGDRLHLVRGRRRDARAELPPSAPLALLPRLFRRGRLRHHGHVRLRRLGAVHLRAPARPARLRGRSEEHTSELQSLMRISYAVFCLKKKKPENNKHQQ